MDPKMPDNPGPRSWHRLILAACLLTTIAAAHAAPLGIYRYSEPQPAPPLTLQDIDGNAFDLEDHRGNVVVVNFWATWCVACRKEIPSMEEAENELREDGVEFVTVAMGQGAGEVREFLDFFDFSLLKLVDPESGAALAWRVQMLPTSYVVDTRGRKAMRVVGDYDWNERALVDELRKLATGS